MARRSDHSREEIKQLALDAAETLVNEHGQQALTARKVASKIGYTVGTLYLVFTNLNDLILHLNGRTLDHMLDWMLNAVSSQQGKPELKHLAHAYIDYVAQHTHRWNLLESFVVDTEKDMPDWYQQKLDRLFGLIENNLHQQGGLQDEKQILQASRVLWAGVHGICLLKIRRRMDLAGGQSSQQMADMLIENFMRGLSMANHPSD